MMKSQSFYQWWALLGVSVLAFTAFLDATIVNTALPFIQTDMKADILQLQWVTNIFTIVLSMTMIAIGKIADIWGRKKIFYYGIMFFAVAALGAGLSTNIEQLVFFRGLQALGASTIFIASSALLSDIFPARKRVQAISIYGGITGFGLMIGPFIGGILIQWLSWRWVFWINLPLIVIGFGACFFSLKGKTHVRHDVKMDWLGLILLVVGLGALMGGIVEGAQDQWHSGFAWICLGVGMSALVSLIILDEKRLYPLLDLHIFKEKIIVLGALSCALAGVASTVFMFFDPLYLRTLRHLSPFLIGLLVAVIPAGQALISFCFSRSVERFGVANLLFVSVLAAFVAALLHRAIQLDTHLFFLILPFFLLGINWGLGNSAMITAVNQVIAPTHIGAAIGTIATIWNLVGSIILALSAAIFQAIEIQTSFLPAFHRVIDFNIGFSALVLAWAVWVLVKLRRGSGRT